MRLRTRILSTFLVAFFASLGLMAFLTHPLSSQALERLIAERLRSLTREYIGVVEQTAGRSAQVLRSWSRRSDLPPHFIIDDLDSVLADSLQDLNSDSPLTGPLECVNHEGFVVAANPPLSLGEDRTSESWFRVAMGGGVYRGPVQWIAPDRPGIRLAFPVHDVAAFSDSREGRVVGVVSAFIDWQETLNLLRDFEQGERAKGFATTSLLVVSRDGLILASSNRNSVLLDTIQGQFPGINLGDLLLAGGTIRTVDTVGVSQLVVGVQLAGAEFLGTDWIGISTQASAEAFAPSRRQLALFMSLGLLLALVLGSIGAVLLERMIRPIQTYVEFAGRVGRGDLTQELAVTGEGDVADLGRSLDQMRQDLITRSQELESRARDLESQTHALRDSEDVLKGKQMELTQLNTQLAEKAAQLERSSQYKSEFLTNMSHELRTPLNSLLILSRLLRSNKGQRLSDREVEYAGTIHSSGTDLLNLINDILDLSKIEAGKMVIYSYPHRLAGMCEDLEKGFRPLAEQKGLDFDVSLDPALRPFICTDEKRLLQVLKNLIANAIKFTLKGRVDVRIEPATPGVNFRLSSLGEQADIVCFRVTDTGIGIQESHLNDIFGAFHQADGTTSRRYGGSGLGLSISRELAALLGGEIQVTSHLGVGSTFSVYLPTLQDGSSTDRAIEEVSQETSPDLSRSGEGGQSDDFDCRSAKISTLTPVLIEELWILDANESRRALVIEKARRARRRVRSFDSRSQLLASVETQVPEVVVLSLLAVGIGSRDFVTAIMPFIRRSSADSSSGDRDRPIRAGILVIADRPVGVEEARLFNQADCVVVRSGACESEELEKGLEAILSLVESSAERQVGSGPNENILAGVRVLVVDDDPRNVYALTEILESTGCAVLCAQNGRMALEQLTVSDIMVDLIVMDIMMPELDGHEATTRIRQLEQYATLPILAVTARAMPGDREKCLQAGASDYLTKPIDSDELIEKIRDWIRPVS